MATTRDTRLADPARLTALLDPVVEGAGDQDVARQAAVLRAEIANFGLATAHVHVRLNASQVHNAVRKQVGMESTPDAPGVRRRVLRALDDLLDRVEPVTVNFGSILGETMTARRLMMVVAKMLRYADSRTPIRFLIAECNDAFTVLAALYLAKLFGVEDRVDISPLFETEDALRHGHDMVRELLRNEHYRAYVEKRGRLCLQTGFSDSGRYMGQTAASLAIERLRVKLAKVLRDEFDLTGVDVVIFDTHGESIGRGAHPEGFAQRLEYAYPPFSRHRFACADIPVKQELSFQGGDGYVFLATPEMALATTCRLLEHALAIPHDACDIAARTRHGDHFYEDTEYSLEFFLTIKDFQDRLMDSPAYAALLQAYGPNLFFPTGSRKAKRQHDTAGRIEESHPSQMRAIPHNGILQQMGFLANSVSGVGAAIATDRDHFAEVYRNSARLQQLMALVAHAWRLSDLDAFDAYTALFDPQFWLAMARAEADGTVREQFLRLSRFHGDAGRHHMLDQVQRTLTRDAVELETGLQGLGGARALTPEVMDAMDPTLRMLHTVRIALIIRLYDLAARIPRFSGQPDVTIEDVVNGLLSLDVENAVASLRRAFPRAPASENLEAFGEPATYRAEREQGYEEEHRELFEPMLQCHELIRRVSAAIAHVMGAVG